MSTGEAAVVLPSIQPKPLPPNLPENAADFLAKRKVKSKRTLNDYVEELHLMLYDTDEKYCRFLYAVYDEQAIEGSLAADNIEAARIIRDKATERRIVEVAREKLATIVKALNVVLRRFGESRKERRNMLNGELVPNPNEID